MMPARFQCPTVQSIPVLDASEYMGIWYEQTRIKNEFFQQQDSVCTQAFYFDLNENGQFWVENSTQNSISQERVGVLGIGSCSTGDGNCSVSFSNMQIYRDTKPNYQILDTDYLNYSLVYSCTFGKQYLWILSRQPTLSSETYTQVLNKAQALLPEFEFNNLIGLEYQGNYCTYISSFIL